MRPLRLEATFFPVCTFFPTAELLPAVYESILQNACPTLESHSQESLQGLVMAARGRARETAAQWIDETAGAHETLSGTLCEMPYARAIARVSNSWKVHKKSPHRTSFRHLGPTVTGLRRFPCPPGQDVASPLKFFAHRIAVRAC